MSYMCPDCEDGTLEAKVREVDLELKDDETAQIVGGVVLITSVGCNNGCSSETDEDDEKPKRKKKKPAAAVAETVHEQTVDCDRPTGHTGRCNHNGRATE